MIRPAYSDTATAAAPDGAVRLDVDGDWGAATGARFRQVLGLPESASWEEACRALQYWLSWALDAYTISRATGGATDRIEVDGSDGPVTWACLQEWWNRCSVPEGSRVEVDGEPGSETYTAVQIALNHSSAGARALACRG